MLLRKPFVNRRRKKKSGLAVDRAEMAHQCSAQALENQFHNDSLRHAQTIKSDRLLGKIETRRMCLVAPRHPTSGKVGSPKISWVSWFGRELPSLVPWVNCQFDLLLHYRS